MMSALFLKKTISTKRTISDRIISFFHRLYEPVLQFALRAKMLIVGVVLVLFAVSVLIFSRLGGEFIPTLEEGDLALHQIYIGRAHVCPPVTNAHLVCRLLLVKHNT